MQVRQWIMQSEVCPLYLIASEKGLQAVVWTPAEIPLAESLNEGGAAVVHLSTAVRQLNEYFAGLRREFDVPLDLVGFRPGTVFQRQVWEELKQIPYGRTYSYRDIAWRIQKEKAVRAVGSANGQNPLSIIVPCHRVVASDGTLGGYAGGLAVKAKLLELERKLGVVD